MSAVERARTRVRDLEALLRDVRSARHRVPSLQRPAAAVGSRGTWTGTVPDRLRRDELTPLSQRLDRSLERAEQEVVAELQHARRALDRAVAEAEADSAVSW